ncbi:MAG: 4Fe-4S binding protein [Desulfobacteraceae bacterium]
MSDIYEKLAVHLDKTPGGYPKTESGVEIRILKRLFTPQEAEIATSLIMMPEPVAAIAERVNLTSDTLGPILASMAEKGLIIHSARNKADLYMQAQFVVGIWEYQVDRLSKELIQDFNEYVPFLLEEQNKTKTKQLRTIPVSQAIHAETEVMAYEEIETIIRSQSKILVAPCICRKEHTIMGKGCGKTEEACLVLGGGAYLYEERGIGRTISQDEAMEIVHKGIEQGLVLQPGNAKKPLNICLCCSCCCQILSNIKKSDSPATFVNSSYFAGVDPAECTSCEACREICPMEAIVMEETAVVDTNRCIGCGLCITACEFDALFLSAKEQEKRWVPPDNTVETYMTIAREKGLL